MGLGAGHRESGSAPSDRAEPTLRRRRRWSIRRSISSFLLCGASSSSSRVMEDCPAELLVNSAEIGDGERLKGKRKGSDLSLGTLVDSTANSVSCRNDIPALRSVPGNFDEVKFSSEIESGEMVSCSSCNGDDARASFMVEPSPYSVSATEVGNFDAAKDVNSITSSPYRISELSNSNNCFGESSLDEGSVANRFAEAIDSYSEDSSYFPDSPIAFHLMQDDNLREMMPSTAEFILLEREQSRQEGSLLRGDLLGSSSNILLSNSVEINGLDIRNYRRSFSFSRNSVFSTDESDHSRSSDGSNHDLSGDFLSNSLQGSFASLGSESSNELGWNSRSEFWERLRGRLDTTDTSPNVWPSRIHAGSSAEESGSCAISRMVVLAQTLFEVLNQIHQQPMSASLSTVSLPAPESVVDSLPTKIHRKGKILECAEDISECHICLAAYDEGDKIRVLPCQHEYHMLCVDKWLKEIHGVCPLCRGDVSKGISEDSCPNLDTLPR